MFHYSYGGNTTRSAKDDEIDDQHRSFTDVLFIPSREVKQIELCASSASFMMH